MKIVIAPDSFKGSLSAVEAVEAMACGVRSVLPDAEVVNMPLADGGEGTASILVDALCGKYCECTVHDPLRREMTVSYGMLNVGGVQAAVIDVAAASGLTLVNEDERDALHASSYGTGQLIKDAMDRGCRNFVIGLGGSATTDAGKGMLEALGARFYDENGKTLGDGGGSLAMLKEIDVSKIDVRLQDCDFHVMCDVDNVLYGETGAAYVFAPQKGATPEDVSILDDGLRRFAECINRDLMCDVSSLHGGGAAGGIGAALKAFCDAELVSGAELVLNVLDFDESVKNADLVLTGEGKTDSQTLMGKLLSHVLKRASIHDVPVVVFAGVVENETDLLQSGFREICCINPSGETVENMMSKNVASNNLAGSVATFLSKFKKLPCFFVKN